MSRLSGFADDVIRLFQPPRVGTGVVSMAHPLPTGPILIRRDVSLLGSGHATKAVGDLADEAADAAKGVWIGGGDEIGIISVDALPVRQAAQGSQPYTGGVGVIREGAVSIRRAEDIPLQVIAPPVIVGPNLHVHEIKGWPGKMSPPHAADGVVANRGHLEIRPSGERVFASTKAADDLEFSHPEDVPGGWY